MSSPGSFAVQAAIVFLGAGLGGVLRYATSLKAASAARGVFPWGTFFINLSGCLAMGALMHLQADQGRLGPGDRLFWMVGVLGGYTTFSTYAHEIDRLRTSGRTPIAFLYSVGSVLLGLASVFIGRLAVDWAAA